MSTVIGVRGIRKIFLAVSSMIVTGFLLKSYRKLREKTETEEEVYRRMRASYDDHIKNEMRRADAILKSKRRRADARETFNRMDAISTPRDGGLMSSIDALQQMAPGRFM